MHDHEPSFPDVVYLIALPFQGRLDSSQVGPEYDNKSWCRIFGIAGPEDDHQNDLPVALDQEPIGSSNSNNALLILSIRACWPTLDKRINECIGWA